MFFMRPTPKFAVGSLVVSRGLKGHLLITGRRWIKPNHYARRMWVYDCEMIEIRDGLIQVITYVSCVTEDSVISALETLRLQPRAVLSAAA